MLLKKNTDILPKKDHLFYFIYFFKYRLLETQYYKLIREHPCHTAGIHMQVAKSFLSFFQPLHELMNLND